MPITAWSSVTSVTVLFKKIKFQTHENIGSGELKMPELEMHTEAFWYSFPGDVAFKLKLEGFEVRQGESFKAPFGKL